MAMMLRGHGGAVGVSRFQSSSATTTNLPQNAKFTTLLHSPIHLMARKLVAFRTSIVACSSAVQESSTAESSATSTVAANENKEAEAAPKPAAAPKPKPPAKAPVKALPEMMEEDIISPLKSILEAQQDITDLELSFENNTLEGSFLKNGNPYTFWAFFPSGNLTGPKGFALSSYGWKPSTIEPFLVDEKKATAKLVVFWIEKRLAAQGIIPVWQD